MANTLSEKIVAGADLYSIYCTECHGPDGEGGEIIGVEGIEDGTFVKSISSQDEMYTRSDRTFFDIIDFGQPNLGMPPFGRGYGGELGPGEIEAIAAFMRYTWDDRAEVPQDTSVTFSVPALAEGEAPSYEIHIEPLNKRYCISCHREGKKNNNYFMTSYEETINSGDNAPNLIAGDLGSNLIRMLHREEIDAGGPMPPKKELPAQYIEIYERWVLAGMPETAEQAAELSTAGE